MLAPRANSSRRAPLVPKEIVLPVCQRLAFVLFAMCCATLGIRLYTRYKLREALGVKPFQTLVKEGPVNPSVSSLPLKTSHKAPQKEVDMQKALVDEQRLVTKKAFSAPLDNAAKNEMRMEAFEKKKDAEQKAWEDHAEGIKETREEAKAAKQFQKGALADEESLVTKKALSAPLDKAAKNEMRMEAFEKKKDAEQKAWEDHAEGIKETREEAQAAMQLQKVKKHQQTVMQSAAMDEASTAVADYVHGASFLAGPLMRSGPA